MGGMNNRTGGRWVAKYGQRLRKAADTDSVSL